MSSWSLREVVRWLQHLLRWKTACLSCYWVNIDRGYVRRLAICCEGEEGMPWHGHPRVVMMPTLSLLITTICGDVRDDQVGIITTMGFQWRIISVRQRRSKGTFTPLKFSNTFKTEKAFDEIFVNGRTWNLIKFLSPDAPEFVALTTSSASDKLFVIMTLIFRYTMTLMLFYVAHRPRLMLFEDAYERLYQQTETLPWRHNDSDGVSNHQPHDCLLNRLFRRRSKKTSKLRVTGLCVGNSPGTDEFPAQMASNAENVSIWWRHHDLNEMGKIFHMIYQNAFSWMEMV